MTDDEKKKATAAKLALILAAMNKPAKSSSKYSADDTARCNEKLQFVMEWVSNNPWYKGHEFVLSLKASCTAYGGLTEKQEIRLDSICELVLGK